jgi:HEAT repeat protein
MSCFLLTLLATPAASTTNALPELVERLRSGEVLERQAAAEALGDLGPDAVPAVPALVDALRRRDTARPAALALARMGPQGVDALLTVDPAGVPGEVLEEALARAGPPAVPALVAALDRSEGPTATLLVEALGRMGPGAEAALPTLARLLRWRRLGLRVDCSSWATGHPCPPVLTVAQSRLVDSGWLADQAGEALARIGPTAVPVLIEALAHEPGRLHGPTLARLPEGACLLRDAWRIRSDCAPLATTLLFLAEAARHADRLQRNDGPTRIRAARALGEIGPAARAAVPALLAATEDPDPSVVTEALRALGAIVPEDRSALPVLLRRLERGPELAWAEWLGASDWLNPERDRALARRYLPRLIERLRDPSPEEWATLRPCLITLGVTAEGAAPALEKLYHAREARLERVEVLETWALVCRDPAPVVRLGLRDPDPRLPGTARRLAEDLGPRAAAALPALAQTLRRATTPGECEEIVRIMRDVGAGSDELVETLAAVLGDPYPQPHAAQLLGELGPAAVKVLPALKARLRDRNVSARVAVAVLRLGGPDRRALAVLEEKLAEPADRRLALDAAAELGPEGRALAPTLRRLLRAGGSLLELEMASLLARVNPGDPEGVAMLGVLVPYWAGRENPYRTDPLGAVERLGPLAAGALVEVAALLQEDSPTQQSRAALALARLGRAAGPVVPLLRQWLRVGDGRVELALAVLGEVGPAAEEALPDLLPLLNDPSVARRSQVAWVLGRIGPAARASLPQLRRQFEEDERWRGSFKLLLRPVWPMPHRRFEGDERGPREWAAYALARIEGDARPYLPELLRLVRRSPAAACALGELGADARPALPALLALLREGHAVAGHHAAAALARLGPHAASTVPELARLLDDRRRAVRFFAIKALAGLGRAAAPVLPQLRAHLTDADAVVSRAAARAVVELARTAAECR